MLKSEQSLENSMKWIEDYFNGPSRNDFIRLWDPDDQTEAGLIKFESLVRFFVTDTNVTSAGLHAEVDQHTIVPRMTGCIMMCRMDERGLPEALEALNDVAQFYAQLDEQPALQELSEPAIQAKGRVSGSETRRALNYSE